MSCKHTIIGLLTLLFGLVATGKAEKVSPSNYCGLNSVYGASVALDKEVPFEALLDRKYLSCPAGSSIRELETAVRDHGMYALTLSGMTPATLRRTMGPVILYVRSSVASRNYDHYTLYLGPAGDTFRCVDESGTAEWSDAQLLSVWSGSGIVVTRAPVSASAVLWRDWASGGALLAGLIAIPMGLRSAHRRWTPRWRLSPKASAAVVVGGVVAVSVTHHRVSAAGLWAKGNVTAVVAGAYPAQFIPKRSETAAYAAWQAGRAVFVDSRSPEVYAAGHIAGAKHVDVHASDEARRVAMSDVARDRSLIVYCQNDQCPYATVLAARLQADGYTDVSIYRFGWDSWRDNPNRRAG